MPFNTLILRSEEVKMRLNVLFGTGTQPHIRSLCTASQMALPGSVGTGTTRKSMTKWLPQSLSDRDDAGVQSYNSWWNALECFHTKRGQDRHEMGPVTAAGTA